jgi:hypothetical protein
MPNQTQMDEATNRPRLSSGVIPVRGRDVAEASSLEECQSNSCNFASGGTLGVCR